MERSTPPLTTPLPIAPPRRVSRWVLPYGPLKPMIGGGRRPYQPLPARLPPTVVIPAEVARQRHEAEESLSCWKPRFDH